jgi:hypothetical protein
MENIHKINQNDTLFDHMKKLEIKQWNNIVQTIKMSIIENKICETHVSLSYRNKIKLENLGYVLEKRCNSPTKILFNLNCKPNIKEYLPENWKIIENDDDVYAYLFDASEAWIIGKKIKKINSSFHQ